MHNGQPLGGALVSFHPKGQVDLKTVVPTGMTGDDGTFTLTTGNRAGAPAGDYIVTIICSEPVKSKPGTISTGPVDTEDRLKGAYADRAKSTLTAQVKPGDNKLDPFDLK